MAEGCRRAGCALLGGETAEHPGVDGRRRPRPGRLRRRRGGARRRSSGPAGSGAGDVLVGLLSPGLRSNGYSLARHVLLERAGLRRSTGRPGPGPTTPWPTSCSALGHLRPGRAGGARRAPSVAVHACAHITGGGIAGNLARVLPAGCDAAVDRRPLGRARASSARSPASARSPTTRWPGSSTSASAWCWSVDAGAGRRRARRPGRGRAARSAGDRRGRARVRGRCTLA